MKRLYYIIIIAFAVFLNACEVNEPILFDESKSFVAFSNSGAEIAEEGGDQTIELMYASTSNSSITVSLEVIDGTAVEGEDFTLNSKEIQFPNGGGTATVTVNPVDNDVFTGDRSFTLVILSEATYTNGANDSLRVVLKDNEHPLATWLGTYTVAADSYGDVLNGEADGAWDEEWTVTVEPDPENIDNLVMTGIGGGDVPIIGTVDRDAMTITIPGGQAIGDAYDYGSTSVYYGDPTTLTFDESQALQGTVSENGTINVDNWAHILDDQDDYVWDVFNTTWTK